MTVIIPLVSLLIDIFHSLDFDHEFWSHSITEKLEISSGLLCIIKLLYCARMFFLPRFCISTVSFRYWYFYLLSVFMC